MGVSLMRFGRGLGQPVASAPGLPPPKISYVDEFVDSLGACQKRRGQLYSGNSLCCWSYKDGYACARTTFGSPSAVAAPGAPPPLGPGPLGPTTADMSATSPTTFLAGLSTTTLLVAAAAAAGLYYFSKQRRRGAP